MNIPCQVRSITNETWKLKLERGKIKIKNHKENHLKYRKGRYAHTTDRRRLVWEDIMWPLIIDSNKSYFTLKEYHIKRNEVCKNRNISPRHMSGGFISLINRGIINHQEELYSIHYKLIPYMEKRVGLDYGTVLRVIC